MKTEEIQKITEDIQKEFFELVEGIMRHPDRKHAYSHQDAVNIFLYKKLAEIEYRLRKLECRSSLSIPLI